MMTFFFWLMHSILVSTLQATHSSFTLQSQYWVCSFLLKNGLFYQFVTLSFQSTTPSSFCIFLQFLQKVFHASSRSCLTQVDVDNRQYYPAMKQLESYQASRQQNGLPQIHLKIYNMDAYFLPAAMAEEAAIDKVEKILLTGE